MGMGSINRSYVYDQLKASAILENSSKAVSNHLGYKQKAPIHKPDFPQ